MIFCWRFLRLLVVNRISNYQKNLLSESVCHMIIWWYDSNVSDQSNWQCPSQCLLNEVRKAFFNILNILWISLPWLHSKYTNGQFLGEFNSCTKNFPNVKPACLLSRNRGKQVAVVDWKQCPFGIIEIIRRKIKEPVSNQTRYVKDHIMLQTWKRWADISDHLYYNSWIYVLILSPARQIILTSHYKNTL